MAEHQALKKALQQMAEGSRSAFHTFYNGTSQYVYSYALLLYASHEDACRFMVDFYQYLYLHLPEHDPSQELEGWISHLLMERYEQLSIGKHMSKPSVQQQMNATVTQFSPDEQERVWRMLDTNIRFPKEPLRRSPVQIILILSALLLLLLLASRYVPAALERLQATNALFNAGIRSDEAAGSGEESGEAEDSETDSDEQEDALDFIQDELDALLDERADTDSAGTDTTDALQMQQSSGYMNDSRETKTPSTPSEPDAPKTPAQPQEPQESQTPSLSDRSSAASSLDDLENLELQLHYGDSLLTTESN